MYINVEQFFKAATEGIIKSRQNIAFNTASAKFGGAKRRLIKKFDEHLVTQEIKAAEDSGDPITIKNISGLLNLNGRGNLFTFLGFTDGKKPTAKVREVLDQINLINRPGIRIVKKGVIFEYPINNQDLEQSVIDASPMDWESGNSWVEGIKRGVSGLSNYIYWKKILNNPAVSRSTGGTQAKNELRSASMQTTDTYLLDMLKKFKEEL